MRFRMRGWCLGVCALFLASLWGCSREQETRTACDTNLRVLQAAKSGIAFEGCFGIGDELTEENQVAWFSKETMPVPRCPGGGTYRVGLVGESPRCSVHGSLFQEDIHIAALQGDCLAMRIEITKGADVDSTCSSDSWTPLHYAAWADRLDIVQLLLANGANVNPKTRFGQTPLDLTKNPSVIAELKQRGGILTARREENVLGAAGARLLSLKLDVSYIPANRYRFDCRLINESEQSLTVTILCSSGFCRDNTTLVLKPGETYVFRDSVLVDIDFEIEGDVVTRRHVKWKSGTAEMQAVEDVGMSVQEVCDSTRYFASAYVEVAPEKEQGWCFSIRSPVVYYLKGCINSNGVMVQGLPERCNISSEGKSLK